MTHLLLVCNGFHWTERPGQGMAALSGWPNKKKARSAVYWLPSLIQAVWAKLFQVSHWLVMLSSVKRVAECLSWRGAFVKNETSTSELEYAQLIKILHGFQPSKT